MHTCVNEPGYTTINTASAAAAAAAAPTPTPPPTTGSFGVQPQNER